MIKHATLLAAMQGQRAAELAWRPSGVFWFLALCAGTLVLQVLAVLA